MLRAGLKAGSTFICSTVAVAFVRRSVGLDANAAVLVTSNAENAIAAAKSASVFMCTSMRNATRPRTEGQVHSNREVRKPDFPPYWLLGQWQRRFCIFRALRVL